MGVYRPESRTVTVDRHAERHRRAVANRNLIQTPGMRAVVEEIVAAEQFKELPKTHCKPFLAGFVVDSRGLGAVLYAQELVGGAKVLLDSRFR